MHWNSKVILKWISKGNIKREELENAIFSETLDIDMLYDSSVPYLNKLDVIEKHIDEAAKYTAFEK
jgi:hypothetical protein